jgi:hypothetical protein
LGQIVPEITVGKYYEADFCSKWSFVIDETDINTWTMTRDLSKVLNTKMYYYKDNALLHAIPAIHAQAILDGVRAEKVSKLLEDILSLRVKSCLGGADMSQLLLDIDVKKAYDTVFTQYKQFFYTSDLTPYSYENQINLKLGLTYSSIIELYSNGSISTA